MNKKGGILGIIVISIIIVIVASMSSSNNETFDVDMTRTHGSISTALGSPILGDPLAPILLLKFWWFINVINATIGFIIPSLWSCVTILKLEKQI